MPDGVESSIAPTNEAFMRDVIALSIEKMEAGEGGPFGAVVVKDGKIIGRGWNSVTSLNDPTAHAEVMTIRAACKALGTFELSDCEIYYNCEPCPCALLPSTGRSSINFILPHAHRCCKHRL